MALLSSGFSSPSSSVHFACLFCGQSFDSCVFCPQSGLRHSDLFKRTTAEQEQQVQRKLVLSSCPDCNNPDTPFCAMTGARHNTGSLSPSQSSPSSASEKKMMVIMNSRTVSVVGAAATIASAASAAVPDHDDGDSRVAEKDDSDSPDSPKLWKVQMQEDSVATGFEPVSVSQQRSHRNNTKMQSILGADPCSQDGSRGLSSEALSSSASVSIHHQQQQQQGQARDTSVASASLFSAASDDVISSLARELRQQQLHVAALAATIEEKEGRRRRLQRQQQQEQSLSIASKRRKMNIAREDQHLVCSDHDRDDGNDRGENVETNQDGCGDDDDDEKNDKPRLARVDGFGLFSSANPAMQRIREAEVAARCAKREVNSLVDREFRRRHETRVDSMTKLFKMQQDAILEKLHPRLVDTKQREQDDDMEREQMRIARAALNNNSGSSRSSSHVDESRNIGSSLQREERKRDQATTSPTRTAAAEAANPAASIATATTAKTQQQQQQQQQQQSSSAAPTPASFQHALPETVSLSEKDEKDIQMLQRRIQREKSGFLITAPRSSGGVLGHIAGHSKKDDPLRLVRTVKQCLLFVFVFAAIFLMVRTGLLLKESRTTTS